MIAKRKLAAAGVVLFVVLTGCDHKSTTGSIPGPVAMTEEAVGHYCNMNVLEHTGPKAQIHLKNIEAPIWFSQVRDAIVFLRSPEETQEAVAIYVNDMGKAENWDFPGDDTWIDINTAFFVTGSSRSGGMGAAEAIPFGKKEEAQAFAARHGGDVVGLKEIPDVYVLGPVGLNPQEDTTTGAVK